MARLFIGSLKRVAFDWFDLEIWFLSRFYEDNTEVTMDKLLSTVQKGEEYMREYIKRYTISLSCVPQACPYPCCSKRVGITYSIGWKFVWCC